MITETKPGHEFGGPWTLLKVDVLKDYLNFYTTALKNTPFKLAYIDAFAGSGEFVTKGGDHTTPHEGSAQIALNNDPPFDNYYFIENDEKHFNSLKKLCAKSNKNIKLYFADANETVLQLCNSINWKKTRAVMFLDPYGLEVDWNTLEAIAKTKAIDLWYLFSISGLYRQAARNYAAVDEHKAAIIDKCLGTTEWRDAFYKEASQMVLFGNAKTERTAEVDDLLKYVQEDRLSSIFAKVTEPLILPRTGAPLFALFLAVSNPKAVDLSMKVANHILKSK